MKKISTGLALACFLLPLSNASQADITYGVGITWVPKKGVAVGARIFSDDEEDSTVASLGVDYEINSKSWRPAAGVAYLGDSAYGEVSLGYNLVKKEVDWGIGAGYVDTEEEKSSENSGSDLPDPDTDVPI